MNNLINQTGSLLIRLSGGRRRDEKGGKDNEAAIIAATNEFATRVTTPDDPNNPNTKDALTRAKWIVECFAEDAKLRPTVGQVIRSNSSTPNIENYFATYFSASVIKTLAIKNADFNVRRIGPNTYENLAYVQFTSNEKDKTGVPVENEVTAEMSFIFRKEGSQWKIVLLDSNPIYQKVPDELRDGGDNFKLWDLAGNTNELTDEEKYVFTFNNPDPNPQIT